MIQVKQLSKSYGRKVRFSALNDVNLEIARGSAAAIVGKSGSGKSTLMHLMSGLDNADSGEVIINGQNILTLKSKAIDEFRAQMIGFIFQAFFVQANETCYDNVSLPLEITRVPRRLRREKIMAALESVELADKIDQKAGNLSGGQKQRLAIARAIVNQPQIIFADEPTGNLDSATGKTIEDLLFSLNKDRGVTLIIVTHDTDLAARCDQRIFLKDGKVVNIEGGHR